MYATILQDSNVFEVIERLNNSDDFSHKIYINIDSNIPDIQSDILIDYLYGLCKHTSVEIIITNKLTCNIVKLVLHLKHVADIVFLDSIKIGCDLLYKDMPENELLLSIVSNQVQDKEVLELHKKLL